MSAAIVLSELGEGIPLTTLDPAAVELDARERWRRVIAGGAAQLRMRLGLRSDPLVLVEGAAGPVLRTVGIAGTLQLAGVQFDIAPKHVVDPRASKWAIALISMVERSQRRQLDYTLSSRLELEHGTFADYYAYAFAVSLEHAARREPIRLYRTSREHSPVLRGRLMVSEQLRGSLLAPHRLICEVDRLVVDNPLNQLLAWAGAYLLSGARDGRVRETLSHRLAMLADVTIPRSPPRRVPMLPRQFAHFATAVELATSVARAKGPHAAGRIRESAGFVVGTERTFERFLEGSLRAVASRNDWDVEAQTIARFAEPVAPNKARTFFSRPDNVVSNDGVARLVVDAKYKRFEEATEQARGGRPTNADLYELAAASVAHGCDRGLLVYPRLDDADAGAFAIRWWTVAGWSDDPLKLGVATVDLSVLTDRGGLAQFDNQLEVLIEEALV